MNNRELSPAEEFYNNSKHPPMDSKWAKNFAEDQKKKQESTINIKTP